MTNNVLVTGGAGYIGSHTVRHLLRAGFHVVVADNLYSGHRWAVDAAADFVEVNAGDRQRMTVLLRDHRIQSVIHFAGHIVVPESVSDPLKYYQNNCVVSQNLIQACRDTGVGEFIFSSSAAVYGTPDMIPVNEDSPCQPINPYGRTKLITEWMLHDVAQSALLRPDSDTFRYVALRYFNVAGASMDGTLGQATPEATHLIKVACETACGKRPQLEIFGTDYNTPDGTCIRDYIHVDDLAAAHVMALDYLRAGCASQVLNCGYGRGFSVREVVDAVRKVSGVDFRVVESGRRAGDPEALVADSSRIRSLLGWQPEHDDLTVICESAYRWEQALGQRRTGTADTRPA